MLTFIVTITMVFAVAAPVTAFYEQHKYYGVKTESEQPVASEIDDDSDCVGIDLEINVGSDCISSDSESDIKSETDVESESDCQYDYSYNYGYNYGYDFDYNYGFGYNCDYNCGDVGSEIEEIEPTDGAGASESNEIPIMPFGSPYPVWVASSNPVIVSKAATYVDFSVTFDLSLWPQYQLDSAPLAISWQEGAFQTPISSSPVSAIRGFAPLVGQPIVSLNPTPPEGYDQLGIAHGLIGGQTDIITLHLRLNIMPGTIPNPGDSIELQLTRGLVGTFPPAFSSITIFRVGNLNVTYSPGAQATATNMPNPLTQTVTAGDTITVAPAPNAIGFNFTGWHIEGPTGWILQNTTIMANGTFTMPDGNVTLTAQWQATGGGNDGGSGSTNLTVTFDLQGGTATFPLTQTVRSGERISEPTPPPTRENFTFAGWYTAEAGGAQFNFATPITANITIFARWHSVLIKLPDRTTTQIGDTISWTLKGFHNPTNYGVTNFAIVDTPGRGLNFQSGRLPAFTVGSGITYDIFYSVDGDDTWRTYRYGVDASRPYSFSLPQDGNTFYSGIKFYFGDVPVGFGLGNEIVMTFVVGYGAPNNQLVNRFFLLYNENEKEGKNPDKPTVLSPDNYAATNGEASEYNGYYAIHDSEYFEIGGPNVPLGGFYIYGYSDVPQTGVNGSGIGLMLLSLFALVIFRKRKTVS